MKTFLLTILIYMFNLIIKPVTYKINTQFYNIYSKEILKLIVNTTHTLSFWNIFNLILICLKNKMFKDIEDTTLLKLNSDLDNLSSNYKKSLVAFKLEFISYMLTLSFIFKFISTFWYLILILPLRTLINFIILLLVGLDLNYFIDIWNEMIYPYFISSLDYCKSIFNDFKVNLQNLINDRPNNQIDNINQDNKPVWSEEDILLMQQMKEDYQKTNEAINNLNDNSINPAWYILGACGILFIGIGIYIYFIVDRSVDDAVRDVVDSVKDLGTFNNLPQNLPQGLPSNIHDVTSQSNINLPSTSTGPGTLNSLMNLTDNSVNSTAGVTSELSNIINSSQDGLSKLGGSVKNVAGKVANTVKDGTNTLNAQGRTIVTTLSEHVSNIHDQAVELHNPQTRPVINTTGVMKGVEAIDYSIPGTANPKVSPLKNSFEGIIDSLKPQDKRIDVNVNDYAETFDHYYQPSQPSSAQPTSLQFKHSDPIVNASLENIWNFEQSQRSNSGSQTPTVEQSSLSLNIPSDKDLNLLTHRSNSPTTTRVGIFSSDVSYPRFGVRFSAGVPSPVDNSELISVPSPTDNSEITLNSTPNLLIHPTTGSKFSAHLNDDFNVKPNVIPELVKLPETPLASETSSPTPIN